MAKSFLSNMELFRVKMPQIRALSDIMPVLAEFFIGNFCQKLLIFKEFYGKIW